MNRIVVISAGPGSEQLLTAQAHRALADADLVFCAARHEALAPAGHAAPLFPFDAAFARMEEALRQGRRTAVLLSGDACFFSLLPRLRERFGPQALEVVPGVSSVQAFAAALALPWQGAAVLSAHGRDMTPAALCHHARTSGRVFLLLDREHDAAWVRHCLDRGGLSHVRLTLGDRLTYPDAYVGPAEARESGSLSLVLAENDRPEQGLPPIGLPDDAFVRGKTPMTKREMRTLALAWLHLSPDAVVWDVGAGTGSITVECARQCPLGHVYAVERDAEACALVRQNVERFSLLNVTLTEGEAPDALRALPCPTHVFLGGTGDRTEAVLDLLEALPGPIRIAAGAVSVETIQLLTRRMGHMADFSAVQLTAARLTPARSHTLLLGGNPAVLFTARTGGNV